MQKRPIVVQKFGGTSVATINHIKRVASRVLERKNRGFQVVVVVSAMNNETDRLLKLAGSLAPSKKELDVLLATGEQASASLMAMALRQMGQSARSFLGHQVKILTDEDHSNASIKDVETIGLRESLDRDEIPVVAGFQGVSANGSITTLGRGGSDTTAVALSAALRAPCEIYTDVDGVYTADPRVCPSARRLECVSYPQMFAMAKAGAKVLHDKCVLFAKKFSVPVLIRHSFESSKGSLVTRIEGMDSFLAVAASHARSTISVVGRGIEAVPTFQTRVLELLEQNQISVGRFTQSQRTLSCLVGSHDLNRSMRVLHDGLGLGLNQIEEPREVSQWI